MELLETLYCDNLILKRLLKEGSIIVVNVLLLIEWPNHEVLSNGLARIPELIYGKFLRHKLMETCIRRDI